MKMFMLLLFLAFVAPAMAAESDSKANPERNVADDLEIATRPNGETVTRLVSRNRITVRQYWIGSVYGNQQSIVVFQGKDGALPGSPYTHIGQQGERRIARIDRLANDRIDLETRIITSRGQGL